MVRRRGRVLRIGGTAEVRRSCGQDGCGASRSYLNGMALDGGDAAGSILASPAYGPNGRRQAASEAELPVSRTQQRRSDACIRPVRPSWITEHARALLQRRSGQVELDRRFAIRPPVEHNRRQSHPSLLKSTLAPLVLTQNHASSLHDCPSQCFSSRQLELSDTPVPTLHSERFGAWWHRHHNGKTSGHSWHLWRRSEAKPASIPRGSWGSTSQASNGSRTPQGQAPARAGNGGRHF